MANKKTTSKKSEQKKDEKKYLSLPSPSPAKRKKQEPRSRWHCLTCYIDINEIPKLLTSANYIKHWAYCYHDKDVESNGSPKGAHTHILLYTYNAKTSSSLRKKFDNFSKQVTLEGQLVQNTLSQLCTDPVLLYRYLIHADDLDKYQYSSDDRIVDDVAYWLDLERSDGCANNIAVEIFDSCLEGMSTREMLVRYGCEYAHNADKYRKLVISHKFAQSLEEWEREHFQDDKNFIEMLDLLVGKKLQNSPFPQDSRQHFYNILLYVMSLLRNDCDLQLDFVDIKYQHKSNLKK